MVLKSRGSILLEYPLFKNHTPNCLVSKISLSLGCNQLRSTSMEIKEYAYQEFNELAKAHDWEVYSQSDITRFANDIAKSQDPVERAHGVVDFVSLTRAVVVNEDLSKSLVFYRPSQIEWKEEVIEKAGSMGLPVKNKQGFYKDTPENRKKGIVGMPYKTDEEYKKKEKEKKEVSKEKED